jgi:ribonucleoside-diphosphate reductase alpha chain
MKASTEYFQGDNLAANVWVNKYALKNSEGNLFELTPDDMHHRIAYEIARIEKKYPNPMKEDEVYQLIRDFQIYHSPGKPDGRDR